MFRVAGQRHRARAAADDGGVFEVPERVGAQPVDLLGADYDGRHPRGLAEPIAPSASPWQSCRVTDERFDERRVFQQRGHMAGRRGENRFRKQQRAGGGGIAQRLVEKTVGVLDAAGLEADDDPNPPAFVRIGAQSGGGFQSGGGGIVGDRAGAPQTRMSQKRRAGGGLGLSRAGRAFSAGPRQGLDRQRLPFASASAGGQHQPAGETAPSPLTKTGSWPPPQNQGCVHAAETEGIG